MKNRISIPKPCHENWDLMLPEQQGRHCLACSKTVIDFTNWELKEITAYLQHRRSEKVCGRFNQEQVMGTTAPAAEQLISNVMAAHLPMFRKIAAVIVICFGLLYNGHADAQHIKGKVAHPEPAITEQLQGEIAIQTDTIKQKLPVRADTLRPTIPQIMGMIAPYHPPKDKQAPAKPPKTTKTKGKR